MSLSVTCTRMSSPRPWPSWRAGAQAQQPRPGGQAAGGAGLDRRRHLRRHGHADGHAGCRRRQPDGGAGQPVRRWRRGRQQLRPDPVDVARPLGRRDAVHAQQPAAGRSPAERAGRIPEPGAQAAEPEGNPRHRARPRRRKHHRSPTRNGPRARCCCTGVAATRCAPASPAWWTSPPPRPPSWGASSSRAGPRSAARMPPSAGRCGQARPTPAWCRRRPRWWANTPSAAPACPKAFASRSVRRRT